MSGRYDRPLTPEANRGGEGRGHRLPPFWMEPQLRPGFVFCAHAPRWRTVPTCSIVVGSEADDAASRCSDDAWERSRLATLPAGWVVAVRVGVVLEGVVVAAVARRAWTMRSMVMAAAEAYFRTSL